jgi:hypothetical protein
MCPKATSNQSEPETGNCVRDLDIHLKTVSPENITFYRTWTVLNPFCSCWYGVAEILVPSDSLQMFVVVDDRLC